MELITTKRKKSDPYIQKISITSFAEILITIAAIILGFHYYSGYTGDSYFISRWANLALVLLAIFLIGGLRIYRFKLKKMRFKYMEKHDDSPSFDEAESYANGKESEK